MIAPLPLISISVTFFSTSSPPSPVCFYLNGPIMMLFCVGQTTTRREFSSTDGIGQLAFFLRGWLFYNRFYLVIFSWFELRLVQKFFIKIIWNSLGVHVRFWCFSLLKSHTSTGRERTFYIPMFWCWKFNFRFAFLFRQCL